MSSSFMLAKLVQPIGVYDDHLIDISNMVIILLWLENRLKLLLQQANQRQV